MKSIKSSKVLQCPNGCDDFESEFWTLIDAASAPELKEAALGGELNLAVCPSCEQVIYHTGNLIYFDSRTGLLIFMFDEAERAQEKELKEKMHHDFNLIKNTLAKEMNVTSEPLYVFGLEALKEIVESEDLIMAESEVVAAGAATAGLKIAALLPDYARVNGYPFYIPVKESRAGRDLLASAQKVKELGINSPLLNRFIADLEAGKTEAQFL